MEDEQGLAEVRGKVWEKALKLHEKGNSVWWVLIHHMLGTDPATLHHITKATALFAIIRCQYTERLAALLAHMETNVGFLDAVNKNQVSSDWCTVL